MKSLPETDDTLLVRTDFSDQAAWQALLTTIKPPNEGDGFANVHIVDDPAYRDLTTEQLIALAPSRDYFLLIVADRTALAEPETPLLAVLLDDEEYEETEQDHGEVRVTAAVLWSFEINISLANMDWWDYTDSAGDDGVFRGF